MFTDYALKAISDASKIFNDPMKAIKAIFGIDIPDEQIKSLIEGVKAKVLNRADNLLNSIKKLF
ncbi:MAG: hypothetical protein GXY37_02105 [Chloroflexi bacterium]|nr:hypothetical protein [Chloroflexota bacterium]